MVINPSPIHLTMNVFAELIEELKEEKLLEETVMDTNRAAISVDQTAAHYSPEQTTELTPEMPSRDAIKQPALSVSAELATPIDDREFFRKRAMEEVSSLQMVEHILSGIEREHMKKTPVAYDDLGVKKALHAFLQVSGDLKSDEHSDAEYRLMQETEYWCSALSKRDANVSVANIRRFCENSKPVLSSQALMALARFYRNTSYSEPVRGKFDFVMTKLFSRDIGEERRKLLFGRIEMIGHIKTLYANWSSIAFFSDEEDLSKVSSAVVRFDEFVREAETAASFDALVAGDFFNRIRLFKEETNEMFFAPEAIAAAMECNVRIGNRFVDLIHGERESSNVENIEEKYGYSYDTIISNAASKTLLLVDLLKEEKEIEEPAEEIVEEVPVKPVRKIVYERAPVTEDSNSKKLFTIFGANKWLVLTTILVAAIGIGVYFWSANTETASSGVSMSDRVDMTNSPLKPHLRDVSSSNETLYAVAQPTYESMSESEKEVFLRQAVEFAGTKGLKRVNLMNNKGRTIGFASGDKIQIVGQ